MAGTGATQLRAAIPLTIPEESLRVVAKLGEDRAIDGRSLVLRLGA